MPQVPAVRPRPGPRDRNPESAVPVPPPVVAPSVAQGSGIPNNEDGDDERLFSTDQEKEQQIFSLQTENKDLVINVNKLKAQVAIAATRHEEDVQSRKTAMRVRHDNFKVHSDRGGRSAQAAVSKANIRHFDENANKWLVSFHFFIFGNRRVLVGRGCNRPYTSLRKK